MRCHERSAHHPAIVRSETKDFAMNEVANLRRSPPDTTLGPPLV